MQVSLVLSLCRSNFWPSVLLDLVWPVDSGKAPVLSLRSCFTGSGLTATAGEEPFAAFAVAGLGDALRSCLGVGADVDGVGAAVMEGLRSIGAGESMDAGPVHHLALISHNRTSEANITN